jgi:chemotaxis protein CheY-P-specific phosphatase CheC
MSNYMGARELEVAKQLMHGGLNSAIKSMGQILNSPISLQILPEENLVFEPSNQDSHIIKTVLKGEIIGTCYLILTEQEVNIINSTGLPKSVMLDISEHGKAIRTGFITEIDNMISAAVVTELANSLNILLYGDVPSQMKLPNSVVNEYLESESEVYDTMIHFNAFMQCEKLQIRPLFIWMFQSQLMEKIKEILNPI